MNLALAVNAKNDLYQGADGNLALAQDRDAVMQALQQAAQTVLGEMIYAADQGVPYFDTVWGGSPNLAQFNAYLRRAFLAVDGATDVQALTVSVANKTLTYNAVITTVYGTVAVNG